MEYTQQQLEGFRKVHAALTKRANDNDLSPEEWAQEVGIDAFERIVAEECQENGVNLEAFNAWSIQPDGQTEFLDNMGAFLPEA